MRWPKKPLASFLKGCEMKGNKQRTKLNNRRAQKARKANGAKRPRQGTKVGKPWDEPWSDPADPKVPDANSASKDFVSILLAVACVILLFALAAHAMVVKDQGALKDILSTTRMGLVFAALWGGGRAALKLLGGWRDHD